MKVVFLPVSGNNRDSPQQKGAVCSGRHDRKHSRKPFVGTNMEERRKRL